MTNLLVELVLSQKNIKGDYAMSLTNSITNTPNRERGKHLTFEDRCAIKICLRLKLSYRAIADIINCSVGTISYEIKKGTGERNGIRGRKPEYSAKRGQQIYESNRSRCHKDYKVKADNPFIAWVIDCVRNKKWSIDACVGFARKNNLFPNELITCTKTLYNAIWKGLILSPFDLPEALSRNTKNGTHRKNKRIYGTSIDERPESFASRQTCGHWEIDTVVGHKAGKESVVLTLVEKVTDYYIAIKIPSKTSEAVLAAIEVLRDEYGEIFFGEIFKSITADNGTEFEGLSKLEDYGTKVYFAHPYSSWERPQNERHNRIFRRYIPKGVSIDNYTAEQILCFADDMNALPRKILGYATPEDLYDDFLDQVYSIENVQGKLITKSVQFEIAI